MRTLVSNRQFFRSAKPCSFATRSRLSSLFASFWAAVSGLVTASLALALVATTFAAQLVYSDYYTCTNDALTNKAKQSCTTLLPKELRGLLGQNN